MIRLALQSRRRVRVRLTELSLNRLRMTAAVEFLIEAKGRREEDKQSGAVRSMAIGWRRLLVSVMDLAPTSDQNQIHKQWIRFLFSFFFSSGPVYFHFFV